MEALLTEFKIVFTDKEFVIIPVNYLLSLNVAGIKESRHMKFKGLEEEAITISKKKYAELIEITVAKEAENKIFTSAGKELFKRILLKDDIRRIELKYSDGTGEIIFADYSADFTTGENEWQTGKTINGGRLLISVINPAAISY